MRSPFLLLLLVAVAMQSAWSAEADQAPSKQKRGRDTFVPPPEIASLLSTLGPGLTKREVEEKLGSDWYEVAGETNKAGYTASYFRSALPDVGIRTLYGLNEVRVVRGEEGETVHFAGSAAPLLKPAAAFYVNGPLPRVVSAMAVAAPLWRMAEKVGLITEGAMSAGKQYDAAQTVALLAELLVVALPLLLGSLWRRTWSGFPAGMLLTAPVSVILGWIVDYSFQRHLLWDLGINYADSIGDQGSDGVGSNIASTFFGWMVSSMMGAVVIAVILTWRRFGPHRWFGKGQKGVATQGPA